ncbi:MAG: M23 family metallopeptidase [Chloroflexota bacterium]
MRPLLAILGVVVFGGVAAFASRAAPATSAATDAARAVPAATADPRNTARVDAEQERGRVPMDDGRASQRQLLIVGLALPIDGAVVPGEAVALPNAPRDYRGGQHEGIDFAAALGTPVRAVAAGTVVRVDRDFTDWDQETREAALAEAQTLGDTPSRTLDRIRGRQVWIAHGRGVTSRYAHLAGVADLVVGQRVSAGTVIGTVGSSGYPGGGPHLHLEIRVGRSFLGDGLTGDALATPIRETFAAP